MPFESSTGGVFVSLMNLWCSVKNWERSLWRFYPSKNGRILGNLKVL